MDCATETQFMRRVNLKVAFISPSLPFLNTNDNMQVLFEYFEYIENKGCPIKRIQKMRNIFLKVYQTHAPTKTSKPGRLGRLLINVSEKLKSLQHHLILM